ncbi:hypothetical protein J7L13_00075 [bacterium]|nr:hypothetical protein [bacterium]
MRTQAGIEKVRKEILTEIRRNIEKFLNSHIISDILYESCVESFKEAEINAAKVVRYDMKTGKTTLRIGGCDDFAHLGYIVEDMLMRTIKEKDPLASVLIYDLIKTYCIGGDMDICDKIWRKY